MPLEIDSQFPRLCYLGSLPVEATSASMMLLYRLLESFPKERLAIVQTTDGTQAKIQADRQIPGASYYQLPPLFRRGWYRMRMRHPRLFWNVLNVHASWQARKAARLIAPFRPDAILTIHEKFGWLTAHKLAEHLKVPLHLVLHDEWSRNVPMAPELAGRFEKEFGAVYRSAASRLCISPYMEEEYRRRYGASGTVLYPSWARNRRVFDAPPPGLRRAEGPLTVAYGGNVFHQGYWESLRCLASALESFGGRLLIFGPDKAQAAANGLARSNVTAFGFVYDMLEQIREQAQVLFLPMTFEKEEKVNMQISFPSKLAEYTASGLPLLIYGPDYCSAVRWAGEHGDVAEVVTKEGQTELEGALSNLVKGERREQLAWRALEVGDRCFSFDAAMKIFLSAVGRGAHVGARNGN